MSDNLRKKPCLVVREHGVERRFDLTTTIFTIGRAEGNSCRIVSDEKVSRRHLDVVCIDRKYFAVDQGSNNGTYLCGNRIQKAELHFGDVIRVGDTEITLRWMAADPQPTTPPPARESRIFPAGRAVYATTVCLLLATLAATVAYFGVDPARDHWGVARKSENILGNAMYETGNRREETSKRPSPEKPAVVAERPFTPRPEPRSTYR